MITFATSTTPAPSVDGQTIAVPTNRLRFADVGQHTITLDLSTRRLRLHLGWHQPWRPNL